jgi:hypothetical protein
MNRMGGVWLGWVPYLRALTLGGRLFKLRRTGLISGAPASYDHVRFGNQASARPLFVTAIAGESVRAFVAQCFGRLSLFFEYLPEKVLLGL